MFIIIMSLLFQAKYNATSLERDYIREQNSKMQAEICDLKEALDRGVASNKIEVSLIMLNICNLFCIFYLFLFFLPRVNALTSFVYGKNRPNKEATIYITCLCSQVEVLQEEVIYATEEVERLTKVLDEQNSLLQASQEQTAQKDIMIQNLQQKVKSFS